MTPYDRFKIVLVAFALVILWAPHPAEPSAITGLPGNARGGNPEKGGPLPDSKFEERLLALINDYRTQSSEGLLTSDPKLSELAREHSRNMHALGALSHDGFEERFERSGYSICVENVGWGYRTPEEMLEGWKDSEEHNRSMLDDRIGFAGVSREGSYITFFACGR